MTFTYQLYFIGLRRIHPYLHLRLREIIANGGSRGLQVTRMVLAPQAVTNRKDMYAYCDTRTDRKNIYYFKIREIITTGSRYPSGTSGAMDDTFGISRSSSISSLSVNCPDEDKKRAASITGMAIMIGPLI